MSEYEKPVVSTYPATNITESSADIHGEIHNVGDATDGILYQATFHIYRGIGSAYEWIGNYHFPNATVGLYSYSLGGLVANEIYHYDFSATYFKDPAWEIDPTYGNYYMSIVTGWGEQLSFITQEPVIIEDPLVTNIRLWTQESPTENMGGWVFVQAYKDFGEPFARLITMSEKTKERTYVSAATRSPGSFSNRVTVSQDHLYDPPAPTILFYTADDAGGQGIGNIYFNNNVLLEGSLIVEEEEGEERTKSCIVHTKNYGKRLMYALETPSTYFCDIINTNLKNGENWIDIESMFAETISSYIVFPSSLSKGYITIEQKLKDKFKAILHDVEETSIYFLIYGKQKNHETEYMKEIKEAT